MTKKRSGALNNFVGGYGSCLVLLMILGYIWPQSMFSFSATMLLIGGIVALPVVATIVLVRNLRRYNQPKKSVETQMAEALKHGHREA